SDRGERLREDDGVGLPPAELGREDGRVEALRDTERCKIVMEELRRAERVGDERELVSTLTQRLEQCVRRVRELVRRRPDRVLGCEEARQLVVVDLFAELGEKRAHLGGV